MPRQKRRVRIYNPSTGRYYKLQERTSHKRRRGQIKGLWKPKRKK